MSSHPSFNNKDILCHDCKWDTLTIHVIVFCCRFHKLLKNEPYVHLHICNLAAQTGVTRYTQIHDNWQYSKNESLSAAQLQEYTHLLVEAKSKYSSNLKTFTQTHVILDSIESFSQVAMNYKLMPPVRIKTKPALFILERKDFRTYPRGHYLKVTDGEPSDTQSEEEEAESESSNENVVNVVDYNVIDEKQISLSAEINSIDTSKTSNIAEEISEANKVESKEIIDNTEVPEDKHEEVRGDVITEDQIVEMRTEKLIEISELKNNEEKQQKKKEDKTPILKEDEEGAAVPSPKLLKAKKAIDDLKTLRQERKKKAIEKIKSETRNEVVASAKEKLKEIMKRHKHIADELSNSIVSDVTHELDAKDGRGDIPDEELMPEPQKPEDVQTIQDENKDKQEPEQIVNSNFIDSDATNLTNENVDSIVEEVIVRLIDRKIYDDKTKPEDIKSEDRLIIQRIVEEVLSEKMNYTNVENK